MARRLPSSSRCRIGADQKTADVTCFNCSVYVEGQVGGEIHKPFTANIILQDMAQW